MHASIGRRARAVPAPCEYSPIAPRRCTPAVHLLYDPTPCVQAVDDAIQSVLYATLGPQGAGFEIPVKAPVQLQLPVPLVPLGMGPKGYQG